MKKRFISMLCALSMIFSVVGGITMTSVNAENEPVIKAVATYDQATKKAEIVFSYEGLNTIKGLQVFVPVDADVFEEPTFNEDDEVEQVETTEAFGAASSNYVDGDVRYVFAPSKKKDYAVGESGDIFTLTLTVKDETKLPKTIELYNVNLTDNDGTADTSYGTADSNPAVVISVVNPTVALPATPTPKPTPTPVVTPTPTPKATIAPGVTKAPFITPEPTVEPTVAPTEAPTPTPVTGSHIAAVATYDQATKTATITFKYEGFNTIKGLQVFVPVDADVFEEPTFNENDEVEQVETTEAFGAASSNYVDGDVRYVFAPSKKKDYAVGESGDIFTLTLTVKDETKLPKTIELYNVNLTDNDGTADTSYGTADSNPAVVIPVVNPTVELPAVPTPVPTPAPTATPVPTPVATPALKDVVDDEVKSEIESGDDVQITVEFVNEDGDSVPAVYGDDFVASYEGKELTQSEYTNLMNGYNPEDGTPVSMTQILNGLSFTIYNDTVNGIIPTVTNFTDNTVTEGEETQFAPQATPTPTPTPTPSATPTPAPGIHNGSYGSSGSMGIGGGVSTPQIPVTVPTFTDIDSVPWAKEAINGLAGLGVISGRTSSTFDPNANVTRAEFAKMLVGALGFTAAAQAGTLDSSFADVPSSHWAYKYISVASTLGIVNGYSDTEFGPDRLISRQEMAAMVYRAALKTTKDLSPVEAKITFTDESEIYDYAKEAVSVLQQANIINGMEDGTFAPLANTTRAQAAVVLWPFASHLVGR